MDDRHKKPEARARRRAHAAQKNANGETAATSFTFPQVFKLVEAMREVRRNDSGNVVLRQLCNDPDYRACETKLFAMLERMLERRAGQS